jgi:hypothetical protein
MELFISHLIGALIGIILLISVGGIAALIVLFLMGLGIDKD